MISPRTPEPSSEPVHFEGTWSDSERIVVERAATEAETGTLPSMPGARHAPWVATCHDRGGSSVYAASRHGISEVLSARSAEGLAEEIRGLDLGAGRDVPDALDVLRR